MRTAPKNAIFTQNFAMSVTPGLVMVSLAFHLFVVGTVIFASVLLCQVKSSQVKNFFIPSKENVVPHIKPQRQCTYVKD